MIKVEALWLSVEPMGMRAGTDRCDHGRSELARARRREIDKVDVHRGPITARPTRSISSGDAIERTARRAAHCIDRNKLQSGPPT